MSIRFGSLSHLVCWWMAELPFHCGDVWTHREKLLLLVKCWKFINYSRKWLVRAQTVPYTLSVCYLFTRSVVFFIRCEYCGWCFMLLYCWPRNDRKRRREPKLFGSALWVGWKWWLIKLYARILLILPLLCYKLTALDSR